ncbi:hypothetical protein [Persicirhabdus sediminis]|uniref:Uncharacterized protein n=1 Tax=Persicirhabdus sediminis TaxID=454144 RepID=A0A8J7MG66_9BACT|nr:hypothetical protein [Persicirhabdus sediminis]MBK1792211.1 hypothetical protein [Persicirhabdus sediminis]
MKVDKLGSYTVQLVMMALNTALILSGSMVVATLLKLRGFPERNYDWPLLAVFVRNWGFILVILPAIWVTISISLERNAQSNFSTRSSLISGLLLFAGLAVLIIIVVVLANGAGSIIQVVE